MAVCNNGGGDKGRDGGDQDSGGDKGRGGDKAEPAIWPPIGATDNQGICLRKDPPFEKRPPPLKNGV